MGSVLWCHLGRDIGCSCGVLILFTSCLKHSGNLGSVSHAKYSQRTYFCSKPRDRRDFKSEPYKLATVEGWLVILPEIQQESDTSFQLADPVMRNVYRFRDSAGTDRAAWVYHLNRATRGLKSKSPPTNLISFE